MSNSMHFFVRVMALAIGLAIAGQIGANAEKRSVLVESELTEASGTLYSARDGRIVLRNEETKKSYTMLENALLWRVEQDAAFGHKEFKVRGEVTTYQGHEYLLIRERVSPR